ncbi:MAG: hypothetical protein O7I93_07255 [Gemmatimonadetes bacterium]|nr:hypothetical protein [Gemmatimonadota bacterium]
MRAPATSTTVSPERRLGGDSPTAARPASFSDHSAGYEGMGPGAVPLAMQLV